MNKSNESLIFNAENMSSISAEIARYYKIVPLKNDDEQIELYIQDDCCTESIRNELEVVLGKRVKLWPLDRIRIDDALAKFYLKDESNNSEELGLQSDVSEKDFVVSLVKEAKVLKSSDIHIEIYEEKCRIRFRIDGKLVERMRLKKDEYPSLINKIKIIAGLDISEKRLPQDGRILFNRDHLKFDIRISVLPTLYGEKIVLRILGGEHSNDKLEQLGFSELDLDRYKESIQKPSGIILISGPTGSGKTTTLYATLKLLNKDAYNILTIEDPIEYTLEGVNQVQVREDIGLSFSTALKTFLRQDPDIIMVGEIRDSVTANLAIRAALTGHLVLSTIHTNTAWGTVSRLTEMGVAPFLLASTLNSTVAQRLLRVLCHYCKEELPLVENIFPKNFGQKLEIEKHFVPKGCKKCFFTGYSGRKAIYEVIPVDSQVADYILDNSRKECEHYFKSLGIKNLKESAWELFKAGETSIEEIYPLLLNEQY